MKKTMFITSVIMVVVLAIALTTSSLAWFAAGGNQTVNVNNITVAASSEVSAAGLVIANVSDYGTRATGTFNNIPISLDDVSGLKPSCPVGKLAASENDYTITLSAASFSAEDQQKLYKSLTTQMRSNKSYLNNGVETFQGTIDTNCPASVQYFAVANSGETDVTVPATQFTITPTLYKNANGQVIGDEVAAKGWEANVWAMLFDVTDADAVKLVAYAHNLSGEGADLFSYAADDSLLAENAVVSGVNNKFDPAKFTLPSTTFAAGSLNQDTGRIEHGPAHFFALVVWYDGDDLNKGSSGTSVKVAVRISTQAN